MELVEFDDNFAHYVETHPDALIQLRFVYGELLLVRVEEYGKNYLRVRAKDRGTINIQSSSLAYWRDVTDDSAFTFKE